MRVKKALFTENPNSELILFLDDDVLKQVVHALQSSFSAKQVRVVELIDRALVTYEIEGKTVQVSWDDFAGVDISCKDPELREKLFNFFQNLNDVA